MRTREEILRRLEYQRRVVGDVLATYLASHQCPCRWPQFVYWVGKERPPRSQDSIQNDLVAAALELPFYVREPPAKPEYWLKQLVRCDRCGARWKHFSEEWRMLAFHETLIRVAGPDGHLAEELKPARPISLEAWARFMLGESYAIDPYPPS